MLIIIEICLIFSILYCWLGIRKGIGHVEQEAQLSQRVCVKRCVSMFMLCFTS